MTNPNDPSNPCKWVGNLDGMVEMPGLTKREYFAGLAMNGISVWDAEVNEPIHTGKLEELARACVAYADALIAELNKK